MASHSLPIVGGCLCKAIRYETTAPPRKGAYCHCDMCKKSYGGLFMAGVQFAAASFRFTSGRPKYFRSSSLAQRGFCEACGSPLTFTFDGDDEVWVLLGSLDRPGDWPLTKEATWGLIVHTQTDSKVPWHVPVEGLPQWTSKTAGFQQQAVEKAKAARRL
jgi:hypothetical protein